MADYLARALVHGRRPSSIANDPKERQLGKALINYTGKSKTYDPVFDKEIRGLRPDWFENTTIKKKEKLLKLAKSGGKRPSTYANDPKERQLGQALSSYTCKTKTTYDPVFDKKIRGLRPDWFEPRPHS